MYLEYTCSDITINEWESLMKDSRRANYKNLVRRVKQELPDLYNCLGLNYNNPYKYQTRETKTHYILVHSAIEYFINKE
jgi:hypothetical protein